jgi:hypothetical protein
MACDQISLTRSWPIVCRNNATLTARPPQPWQSQKMPAFSGVRVNPLPHLGHVNMALGADHFATGHVIGDGRLRIVQQSRKFHSGCLDSYFKAPR